MSDQRYEYRVEPMSISPTELDDERHRFDDTLDEYASEGWVLDDTLRVDSSSFVLVFRRDVESQ